MKRRRRQFLADLVCAVFGHRPGVFDREAPWLYCRRCHRRLTSEFELEGGRE